MEKLKPSLVFNPPVENFDSLQEDILRRHPLSPDLSLRDDLKRIGEAVDQDLEVSLKEVFIRTQGQNEAWANRKFEILRRDFSAWSLDGILIDSQGRIDQDSKPSMWSSFSCFSGNNDLPVKMEDILRRIKEKRELLFPITPSRDSTVFWLREFEDPVVNLIRETTREDLEAVDYPINPAVAASMPDILRMARVKRDKFGSGKAAAKGIVLGKIGFWQRSDLGDIKFIPRVYMDKSSVLERDTYVSPLPAGSVAAKGGLTMEEKYGADVVRVGPEALVDFVAVSAGEFLRKRNKPFIFRLNTYRPWLGEYPVHG